MSRHLQVFLLAVGFDLYWLMVVLFRERGMALWLGLAILAFILLPAAQRLGALMLAAAGSCLDAMWALTGLIDFHGEALLPLWIFALWLMFTVMWAYLTRSTTLPGWLLAIIAAGGGPIAYVIGERLGAITFLEPTFIVISLMATGWLMLMLLFHIFMGKHQ